MSQPIRVAIYTRKSTDDGLEMEFNSLDAQYEACLAYVAHRSPLGWLVVPERYDDGGFTGGTMDRPALQRLLRDIARGQIHVVVAYKLDRISRSLLDFANLMAGFEQQGVAFVSVTQEFDSSMPVGRLTLNILSSFAQYEREIIRERTRDKMAASRRKGMYTGGIPPFGYRLDRAAHKLVIDPTEADVVRGMYAEYLQRRSVTAVMQELNRQGIPTKRHAAATGRTYEGGRWYKAYVRKILVNPLYLGQVQYRGTRYPGQHEAVIDAATWAQVQGIIGKEARPVRAPRQTALLKGLIRCGHCGCAMTPSSCRDGAKSYRYYLCSTSHRHGTWTCPTRSVSAGTVETAVVHHFQQLLHTPDPLLAQLTGDDTISSARRQAGYALCLTLHQLVRTWAHLEPSVQQETLRQLVQCVIVAPDHLEISYLGEGTGDADVGEEAVFTLTLPLDVKAPARRQCSTTDTSPPPTPMQIALARAFQWRRMLAEGQAQGIAELARVVGYDPSYIARVLNYTLLAPDLVSAIMQETPLAHLPVSCLPKTWPLAWSEQRAVFQQLLAPVS